MMIILELGFVNIKIGWKGNVAGWKLIDQLWAGTHALLIARVCGLRQTPVDAHQPLLDVAFDRRFARVSDNPIRVAPNVWKHAVPTHVEPLYRPTAIHLHPHREYVFLNVTPFNDVYHRASVISSHVERDVLAVVSNRTILPFVEPEPGEGADARVLHASESALAVLGVPKVRHQRNVVRGVVRTRRDHPRVSLIARHAEFTTFSHLATADTRGT